MIYLRQSTASQEIPLGYFVDSTDGNTEETGLTIANTDIKLWKTGATTLANKNSGGGTHISNGIYYAVLDATDTNTLGPMVIFVHVSGALTVRVETCVLTALVYDSLIAGTDNLQVDILQAAGTAWGSGAITSGVFASGAINRAALAADTGLQPVRSGTAQAGAAGTITLDASASATTDFYENCLIYLTGGTGVGQLRLCSAYNGTSKVATITPNWDVNPDNTSTFAVLPQGQVDIEMIGGAVLSTSTAQLGVNAVQAGGTAWGSGAITAASIAPDAIGASELATDAVTEIVTAVWAAAARTLTAGTNIVLAKGTGVTGFNDLDAAGVATAVWNAATASYGTAGSYGLVIETNLDAAVSTRASQTSVDTVDTVVDSILVDTAEIGAAGAGLTALATQSSVNAIDGIVDAILVDTAEIGAAGTGLTALASAVNLATVDTVVDAIKAKTDNLPAAPAAVGDIPTANANADALLDRADGVETGITLRQSLRLALAALAGKLSGAATTTVTIRDANDAKARITATVDADGNRTAVTLDAS